MLKKKRPASTPAAPPVEQPGWEPEPWNTLWDRWETCTQVGPEPWNEQGPVDLLKYWGQFIELPNTKARERLQHAGRMRSSLLSSFKVTWGHIQALEEKIGQLEKELQAKRAKGIVQQQALVAATQAGAGWQEKLAASYAVRAARHRRRRPKKTNDPGLRVRTVITQPDWDPETWDGNIWSSSESEEGEEDPEQGIVLARAAPVVKKKGAMDPLRTMSKSRHHGRFFTRRCKKFVS